MNRSVSRGAMTFLQNAIKTNAGQCWMVDVPHALFSGSAVSSYQRHAPHSVFSSLVMNVDSKSIAPPAQATAGSPARVG
jgi:hypothetical protein